MEAARDLAQEMQQEGKGIVLDQFGNLDNPLAHLTGTGGLNLRAYYLASVK